MSQTPTIIIHIDPEKDAEKFWKFLNHPEFPYLRNSNLNAHPTLKESVTEENFQEIVHEYIKSFYVTHTQEINVIYERSRDLVESNAAGAFKELSRLMDYEWKEGVTYNAYLSILAVSTFDKDTFTYSILGELRGINPIKKSALSVGIHEISHLIFFELLKSIEERHKIKLHQDGKYFLKEALTTALLNTETLRSILETESDPGNPEIQKLYISTVQEESVLFIDYIKNRVLKSRASNLPFVDLLEQLVLNTHSIEKQLNERRALWNNHGGAILKDETLLAEYSQPIPLFVK